MLKITAEVDYLLQVIDAMSEEEGVVTLEMCEEMGDFDLLDYKFEVSSDGYHKNDGQLVEYEFLFTSPEGKVTNFSTEMCLMVGWNVGEDIEFN